MTTQSCVEGHYHSSDVLWTPSAHTVHTHQHVRDPIQKLFIPTYTNHGPHEPVSILSGHTQTRTFLSIKACSIIA